MIRINNSITVSLYSPPGFTKTEMSVYSGYYANEMYSHQRTELNCVTVHPRSLTPTLGEL